MTQANEVKLIFNKPVYQMQQQARVWHALLVDTIGEFTPSFPHMDAAYVTAFGAAIDTAETTKTTDEVRYEQRALTEAVDNLMKQARAMMQEVFRYVQITYPEDKLKLKAFGQESYGHAAYSQPRMAKLMEQTHDMITANEAELTAKGYTLAKITAFQAAWEALNSKDNQQENKKRLSPADTATYYEAQNDVWRIMQEVHTAAQVVYAGDYAMLNAYELYPETSSNILTFTVDIPVAPAVVYHHFEEPFLPETQLIFKNLGPSGGAWVCFALADGEPCNGSQQYVPTNEERTFTYALLSNGAGQYLSMRQDGSAPIRLNVRVPSM